MRHTLSPLCKEAATLLVVDNVEMSKDTTNPAGSGRKRVTKRDVGARWQEAAHDAYSATILHTARGAREGAPVAGNKRARRKDGTGKGGEEGGEGVT